MAYFGDIRAQDRTARLTFNLSEPEYDPEIQEAAYYLLKSPLEFSDAYTGDIFNEKEQADFERLLNKLRSIAAV